MGKRFTKVKIIPFAFGDGRFEKRVSDGYSQLSSDLFVLSVIMNALNYDTLPLR